MVKLNERLVIMFILNLIKFCEVKVEDIIKWSDGRVLVVIGSLFNLVEYNGVIYMIG